MPFSVLVVCLANVCRSPLGERLLSHRLAERGVGDRFVVASAGVRAMEGRPMSSQSAAELEARGVDPAGFTPTQLGSSHRDADLVLVATRELRSKVLEQLPGLMRRAFTVREFAAIIDDLAVAEPEALAAATEPADLVRLAGTRRKGLSLAEEADVRDPIGRSDEVYAEVAAVMDAALTRLADQLARVGGYGRRAAGTSA